MKSFVIGLLFFVSILLPASGRSLQPFSRSVSRGDECSAPIRDTCTFYLDCLEDGNYDCGTAGYPIGYGQYYCEKFNAAKPLLSPQGQQWVSDTMLCLQTALI